MKAALRQVEDNLEEIFGENWSFEVKNQYMLNGKGTDLGIKYKDTELYKAYIMGPDVTGGLRMLYDLEKSPIPDLNAAETTTDAIAAPITPNDSPPADNLLTIDPDLVHIDGRLVCRSWPPATSHLGPTCGYSPRTVYWGWVLILRPSRSTRESPVLRLCPIPLAFISFHLRRCTCPCTSIRYELT